jgi:hypothetical protein
LAYGFLVFFVYPAIQEAASGEELGIEQGGSSSASH